MGVQSAVKCPGFCMKFSIKIQNAVTLALQSGSLEVAKTQKSDDILSSKTS